MVSVKKKKKNAVQVEGENIDVCVGKGSSSILHKIVPGLTGMELPFPAAFHTVKKHNKHKRLLNDQHLNVFCLGMGSKTYNFYHYLLSSHHLEPPPPTLPAQQKTEKLAGCYITHCMS